jgi:hypothetical protein
MIMGVDHLVSTQADMAEGQNFLEGRGFTARFVERDIQNPPAKRCFMKYPTERHSMVFMTKEDTVSIELLEHERAYQNGGRGYSIVWNDSQIESVEFQVANLSQSLSFWTRGLKAHLIDKVTGPGSVKSARIGYRAPIRTLQLELLLSEAPQGANSVFCDSIGVPTIALLSNRIVEDRDEAISAGAREAGDVFEIMISNRLLKACFLRGPSGEIIEMIQLP